MKLKKIISAVSAFAMAISMVTVANAASLGGKPTVTATFDGYEKVSDTVAFAYVNVTLDMTAAEELEVYSNELDEITWEEVVKGNGITTLGIPYTIPTGFTYTKAKSTIPTGLSVNATTVAFGPTSTAEDYWVEPTTTVRLALRVSSFDTKGTFAFNATTGATVDGKNSAEGSVWGYASLANTIDMVNCDIPSYNEWSKPEEPEVKYPFDGSKAIQFNANENTFVNITKSGSEEVMNFFLPSNVKGDSTVYGLLKYTVDNENVKLGDVFTITLKDITDAEVSNVVETVTVAQ